MTDIKQVFEGDDWISIKNLKQLIEKSYQTEVIEERMGSSGWYVGFDEPREVRFRFRVERKSKEPSSEDKILIYGTLALISEEWGQGFVPEAMWRIKFVKDGKYCDELDYDQIEYQVYLNISYGSN